MLNKGQIIAAKRINVTGQLVTSVKLTITPDMMPSFRFVAFYSIPWSGREEVVPDSIWVDVEDSCVGGVRSFIEKFLVIFYVFFLLLINSSLPPLFCCIVLLLCFTAEGPAGGWHSSRLHSREEL